MATLVVVNHPRHWPFRIPGVDLVSARAYLTDARYHQIRPAKVFNLCRSYRYQTLGYYVSLLAEARGHKPLPSVGTIQELKNQAVLRVVSGDLDRLIQKSLAPIQSTSFQLSIYFGRNLARRYDPLSLRLFNLFPAPLLRAHFVRNAKWQLHSIRPISTSEVPETHRPFVVDVAAEYFSKNRTGRRRRSRYRYDLAILVNPEEEEPPSNEGAIRRFVRAAESLSLRPNVITKEDYGRLAEFDALFIRETTQVNHHTYRFAVRAAAEDLVVIDDPESIVKCTNKVYLAELLQRHEVPTPRTVILQEDNVEGVAREIGFPVILKKPDSSFSQGVEKVDEMGEFLRLAEEMLEESDLVICQEFLPSAFDWRIGILERQPLFACRYHMAQKHWQIVHREERGRTRYGRVESLPLEEVPKPVIRTALRAANLIGDGLYGVDLKQIGRRVRVIEINDNPSIEAGYEDKVLRHELYERVMSVFLRRIDRKRGA